jgi:Glyoxalase-like domain
VWPAAPGEPQMMVHLDIAVENLDEGVAWAREAGAVLAEHQPQKHVRVMLDPDGHPFCLFPGAV